MLLTRDTQNAKYRISAYGADYIQINETRFNTSLLMTSEQLLSWPPRTLTDITTEHVQQILDLKPHIVLLGTGHRLQFPRTPMLAPLQQAGIGVEIMDNGAACRTFTVLQAENRHVVAAILL